MSEASSVTIVQRWITSFDDLDALAVADRRDSGCFGWATFPIRSGALLDTFLLLATGCDLGMSAYEPEDDQGTPLQSSFLDGPGLPSAIAQLAILVESDAAITLAQLRDHGGGTADPVRLEAALRGGAWPESGDPAEEAAAFAHQLLARARDALQFRAGLLVEHRGALVSTPRHPRRQRVRDLERLLATIAQACAVQLEYEGWEAHGKAFSSPEYAATMERDFAASVQSHAAATATLAALVARTRVEQPDAIVAWATAHDRYLAAFLAETTDDTARFVATRERAEWAEVAAGARAYVTENGFFVTANADRYRRLFGIDRHTLRDY